MDTNPTKHLTVGQLKQLLKDLPDDGILVVDNHGEDRVVMRGDVSVRKDSATNDEEFNLEFDEDATEDGFDPIFPCIVAFNSWS